MDEVGLVPESSSRGLDPMDLGVDRHAPPATAAESPESVHTTDGPGFAPSVPCSIPAQSILTVHSLSKTGRDSCRIRHLAVARTTSRTRFRRAVERPKILDGAPSQGYPSRFTPPGFPKTVRLSLGYTCFMNGLGIYERNPSARSMRLRKT